MSDTPDDIAVAMISHGCLYVLAPGDYTLKIVELPGGFTTQDVARALATCKLGKLSKLVLLGTSREKMFFTQSMDQRQQGLVNTRDLIEPIGCGVEICLVSEALLAHLDHVGGRVSDGPYCIVAVEDACTERGGFFHTFLVEDDRHSFATITVDGDEALSNLHVYLGKMVGEIVRYPHNFGYLHVWSADGLAGYGSSSPFWQSLKEQAGKPPSETPVHVSASGIEVFRGAILKATPKPA